MSTLPQQPTEMDFVEKLAAEFERVAVGDARAPRRERALALLLRHRRIVLAVALAVLASAAATVIAMKATAAGPPPPKADIARAMPSWVRAATVPMATDRLGHRPAVIEWIKTDAQTAMRMLGGRNAAAAADATRSTYVVLITDNGFATSTQGSQGVPDGADGMTAMFFILVGDSRSVSGYGYISGPSFRLAFGPMYLDPASREQPSRR